MPYEEALNILIDADGYLMDGWDAQEAKRLITSLIEKDRKYRWHDLRKNPEDLPTHTKTVEVELWSEFLGIYHDHDSIHDIDDGLWMSYPYGGNKWGKVIGWREIEPMEGVNE